MAKPRKVYAVQFSYIKVYSAVLDVVMFTFSYSMELQPY